ncbi:hypothetical protein F7P69_23545 [Cellulosimicrobium funkei]|nr:hypothetical protein [Cellulosimicrobium funkei]
MSRQAGEPSAEPLGEDTRLSAQLAALRAPEARLAEVSHRAARRLAWFCTALALLIGAAHVVPAVFHPDESLPAFLAAMGVYVVAVLALTWGYIRTRKATPRGGSRRYLLGLLITMVLYLAALALLGRETWPVAILVGLVIAAPLVIAGWWRRA